MTIQLTGVSPLVMHNNRLADSRDEYARAIAELTDKVSNRTDSDDAEIERLEWHGGLYFDPEVGIYVPTFNVKRCFEEAAKVTRNGKNITRAVNLITDKVPLQYAGPREPDKLWEKPEFRFRKPARIKTSTVMRMRPLFRKWHLEIALELLEDVMNARTFIPIAQLAGMSEGIGDARKLGYGRFEALVKAEARPKAPPPNGKEKAAHERSDDHTPVSAEGGEGGVAARL